MALVCAALQLYVLVLFARAILSWFPISPDSAIAPVVRGVIAVTEPVLAPARRVIPAVGMFDISFIVVIIGIQILTGAIC